MIIQFQIAYSILVVPQLMSGHHLEPDV